MKKNFVRNLAIAVAVGVMLLGGCGKQEAGVDGNSSATVEHTNYEMTEEEMELVYRLVYAEAKSNSSLEKELVYLVNAPIYYTPTDEERHWAYLMAVAQTQDESPIIQTMCTNVAINRAKANGISLIDVFTELHQFSGIHDGVPSICTVDGDGKVSWTPVTDDMVTSELREAVDAAFERDYTDGALYYYDREKHALSNNEPKEFIQEGDFIFFKEF